MWPPSLVDLGLAACALIILVTVLMSCLWGCKNKNPKSELVGTAGVVTLRCEEDIPSPEHSTPESIKRASGQNSQRSLPEIPHVIVRNDSGDATSDIYATVGLDQNLGVEVLVPAHETDHAYEHAYAKLHNEFNFAYFESRNSLSGGLGSRSVSKSFAKFSEVRSNPPNVSSPASSFAPGPSSESEQNISEAVPISASVAISGQLPSSQELPYITPRPASPALPSPVPPPTSAPNAPEPHYFSGDSTDSTKGYTSISVREPLSQIRAAASHRTQNNTTHAATPHATHPHYATVSDDSDEMYAAIEEPAQTGGGGSQTYAQIAVPAQGRPHAADDEGEDPDKHGKPESVVTPEMPTTTPTLHSREASMSSTTNMGSVLGSPKPEKRQANSPLPPPPSTSHNPHTSQTSHASHTQASSNKGDDSPQHGGLPARQQRISSIGDLNTGHDRSRRSLNEKHQRNNSCVSSSDFYGCNYHVDHQRFSSVDLASTSARHLVAKELNFSLDPSSSLQDAQLYSSIGKHSESSSAENNDNLLSENRSEDSPPLNVEEMYAKVMKKGKALNSMTNRNATNLFNYDNFDCSIKLLDSSVSIWNNNNKTDTTLDNSTQERDFELLSSKNEDPGYETIDQKIKKINSYETVTDKKKTVIATDPQDPGYETVGDLNRCVAVARTLQQDLLLEKLKHIDIDIDSGPESMLGSDPGYEQIRRDEIVQSDSDPNYEVLRPQPPPTPPYATIASTHGHSHAEYSVVDKKHNKYQNNVDSCDSECNYESMPHELVYTTSSESDSNYESVKPKNSNYESVSHLKSITMDPLYERVHNHGAKLRVDRSDSGAGYEKLNPVKNLDALDNSLDAAKDVRIENTVDDYFQV